VSGSVGANARLRANEHVAAREFDEEWVILDLEGGAYYGLDALGGRVWKLLVAGMSAEEAAEQLQADYDVDRAVLLNDVLALVNELLNRGLVTLLDVEKRA